MRQSTATLLVLTLLALGNMAHYSLYILVSGSPFLGVWVLLVGLEHWILLEMILFWTLDTLSAPVLAFRRISQNFYVDVDSVRYVSLFSRRMEQVLSRCFARVLVALLALGNLYIIPTSIRGRLVV